MFIRHRRKSVRNLVGEALILRTFTDNDYGVTEEKP